MVYGALSLLGSRRLRCATEVPFLNRSIDLMFDDPVEGLVAVEFKRRDWRRALLQARDHLLGTACVYVCLPVPRVSKEVIIEADDFGIGLFTWSPERPLEPCLEPKRSTHFPIDLMSTWLRERFELRLTQETCT